MIKIFYKIIGKSLILKQKAFDHPFKTCLSFKITHIVHHLIESHIKILCASKLSSNTILHNSIKFILLRNTFSRKNQYFSLKVKFSSNFLNSYFFINKLPLIFYQR